MNLEAAGRLARIARSEHFMFMTAQAPPNQSQYPELERLNQITMALDRAWIRADDEAVETARGLVVRRMAHCDTPQEKELFESALARLERARRQARLRWRRRH